MLPVIEALDFPAFWADCVNQGRIDDLIGQFGAFLDSSFKRECRFSELHRAKF